VARIPATPEPDEVDAAPVRSVLDQVLAAEADLAPVLTPEQERAAEKRRRAALGEPGWREQNELDALLAERGRFVQRGKDTTHIDAEIARRGGSVPTTEKG
jgi:hypothetical protein